MSIFDNIRTTHNPNEKGVVLTEEESVEFLNSLNASIKMKDLINCSIDELLTERQNAIGAGNIERYRECNELISTWSAKTAKKLQLVEMLEDLKTENTL